MNCEILETLYVKSNGEIPCNDDTGEVQILGRVDWTDPDWTIAKLFEGEHYSNIRSAFAENRLPWGSVCEGCAFLRLRESFSDSIRRRRIRKLQLEPSLACNLSCPCCCNAIQVRSRDKPHIMPVEVIRTLLADLAKLQFELEEVEYCGQGEPLMHPEFHLFPETVRGIFPTSRQRLITNGNFEYARVGVNNYIDEIFVSFDGLFQTSYEQYRRRGNVNRALSFMNEVPKSVNGKKPLLVWKYILFEFNDSDEEIRSAQDRAQDLGVDILMFVYTHSLYRSQRFRPENADALPIYYPNVRTNLTPIIFNRELSRASSISEQRRWSTLYSDCKVFVDEVTVMREKSIALKGWALAGSAIVALDVDIGGMPLGSARYGLSREDVYLAFPRFQNKDSGFSFSAPGLSWTAPSLNIGITLKLENGRSVRKEFSATFE